MNTYVIAFNYKPFYDSQPITEYFLPYTQDALLEIITDKILRQRLEESKYQRKNLDTFVEKYNLENHPNIRIMNEIPIGSGSPNWINDINNISELSLWDFLADAIAIAPAEAFRFDNISYLNSLATATYNSRLDFYYLKIILSLLIYMDDDYNPVETLVPFNDDGPNYYFEETDEDLWQFCKNVCNFLIYDDYHSIYEIERYQESHFSNHPYLQKNISEICSLVIELRDSHLGNVKYKEYKKIIVKLLEESLQIFHPMYSERTNTLAALHALQFEKQVRKKHDDVLENWKCINDPYYHDTKTKLINKIFSEKINRFIYNVEAIGTASTYPSNIDDMNHFFSNDAPTFGKKNYHTNDGCFALLKTVNGERYFAFSSAKEISNKDKEKMKNLVKIVMENVFHIKNVSDVYAHVYPYNWCYLYDNIKARRYTELLEHGSEDPTKYIGFPETYDDDISAGRIHTNAEISNTYGCCERKLLAYSGYSQAVEIYSRWAPCWRCRPAIIDAQPCDIYAFADLDEYKKNNHVNMSLKQYTVITTYSVKS
ncbi:MAG: hypothetical protein IJA34_05760 [Lachnospiraceae bacterium]|nr:hypothetical protein [Lachnospiraceae bacterium]